MQEYEVNRCIDGDRLRTLARRVALPSAGIIAAPIVYCRIYDGLPDDFIHLMFAAMECSMFPGKSLYAGLIRVNGWDIGRPPKRQRKLKPAERLAMAQAVQAATLQRLTDCLAQARQTDPEGQKLWVMPVQVSDPTTQQHVNRYDRSKSGDHLCVLVVHSGKHGVVFDPLGDRSPVRGIWATALDRAGEVLETLVTTNKQVQLMNEHFCVLYCGWFVHNLLHTASAPAERPPNALLALSMFANKLQVAITSYLLTTFSRGIKPNAPQSDSEISSPRT